MMHMKEMLHHGWDVILGTLALDIYDINYAYGSQKLNMLSSPAARLPRPGVLIRCLAFCSHLLESLYVHLSRRSEAPTERDCVAFLFSTANQRISLDPVAKSCSRACLVRLDMHDLDKAEVEYRFPVILFYLGSLPFLPLVVYKLLRSRGYQRRSFQYALDSYWITYGSYWLTRVWLSRKRVRAVIVANDHNAMHRAVVRAARAEGIPTFYVQHASVTGDFPPLSFDYALLEGKELLYSYELAGPSRTKVFLIGMPKLDAYTGSVNTHETVEFIGVCTNTLDPVPRVEELCNQIRLTFPTLRIILRSHPGDRRLTVWTGIARKYDLEWSEFED